VETNCRLFSSKIKCITVFKAKPTSKNNAGTFGDQHGDNDNGQKIIKMAVVL